MFYVKRIGIMKKLFLLIISLLLVFSLTGCKERFDPAPQITEGEFPFVVEYEINGERYLIEDTVVCIWDGYDASNNFAIFGYPSWREWDESLKSGRDDCPGSDQILLMELEEDTESVFVEGRINYESRVIIEYGTAEYYMGDTDAGLYTKPCIRYYEKYYNEDIEMPDSSFKTLSNEQLEKYFGIKIIRFEFSDPVENTFE